MTHKHTPGNASSLREEIMKEVAILLIALIVISVGLSGCNEQSGQSSGNTDEVELVSYSVETQKQYSYEKIGDGFIHTEDSYRYSIIGYVKNIAGKKLDQINVTARFYDSDNEFLHTETFYVNDIH